MHPKNTTAPPGPQVSAYHSADQAKRAAPVSPSFTAEQTVFVIDLLKAERAHASRWWTFLHELRLHRQLPEWVTSQVVGARPDYDHWSADCLATNLNLLGIEGHLNAFDSSQLVDCSMGPFVGVDTDSAPQNEQVPFRGAQLGGGQ